MCGELGEPFLTGLPPIFQHGRWTWERDAVAQHNERLVAEMAERAGRGACQGGDVVSHSGEEGRA